MVYLLIKSTCCLKKKNLLGVGFVIFCTFAPILESRHMKRAYKIPFKSLSDEEHLFDYELDKSFFLKHETLEEWSVEGKLIVKVALFKKDNTRKINILIQGDLITFCDRCLDTLILPFEEENIFFIRKRCEGEEDREDTIFVEPEDSDIELSQLFYEMIMTGIPQKKKHNNETDCNVEMIKRIEQMSNKSETVDPRWSELEKLIKK